MKIQKKLARMRRNRIKAPPRQVRVARALPGDVLLRSFAFGKTSGAFSRFSPRGCNRGRNSASEILSVCFFFQFPASKGSSTNTAGRISQSSNHAGWVCWPACSQRLSCAPCLDSAAMDGYALLPLSPPLAFPVVFGVFQVRDWLRQGCDCVVIAGKYDPLTAVEAMLPHLTPSRPFAVYSEFVEVRGRDHQPRATES